MEPERYGCGRVALDVAERRVTRDGHALPLSPKAFDVLVHLVRRAGRLVTKQELLETIWRDAFVEEGIVAVHISALRKALADGDTRTMYIQTVARSGYRFVAPVTAGPTSRRVTAASAPDVHELVGRARTHLSSVARSQLPEASRAFEAAIELDPAYAPAHAGLALAHCGQAELRLVPVADGFARARAAALRALALDDSSSDAWTALGCVMLLNEWDWIGAERSLQRALDLNAHQTQARLLYGRLLDALGKLDEGLAMKLRALEDDPFSPSVHLAIALSYWNQRRFDDSMRWATKTLDLDPAHGLAREFLAGAFWAMGDFDRHMAENLRHAAAHGLTADVLEPMKRAFEENGRPGVVRLALEEAAAGRARLPDIQFALFHAELGDLDSAIRHLERAIEGRDPCLVDLAVAPQWDSLRGDPRFHRCLEGMRLVTGAPRSADDRVSST